ncbi:unnamed protein product [Amoebophrya sp. A120]|nr:unnamed protein product [Amoebophrya sp. A120]|eukprot:GSA120T00019508001.1
MVLELVRLFQHPGLAAATSTALAIFITFNQHVSPLVLLTIFFQFFTHLFIYPWGWVYPELWRKSFGEKSVAWMCGLVTAQKTLLTVFLLPFLQVPNLGQFTSNTILIALSYCIAAGLITFGIWLQSHVYAKLGRDGVYYGFKFGKSIPWVSDFPFDTFRHPQYTGAYSICLGVYIILGPSIPVFLIGTAQAWGYIFTSHMESSSDQDNGDEKAALKEEGKKEN